MHEATRDLDNIHVYPDDILVVSYSEEQRFLHLGTLLDSLSKHGVMVIAPKCEPEKRSVTSF